MAFCKILAYFQFIKEKKTAGVENVEKCSQIKNNSNKKKKINYWHFFKNKVSKMFLGEINRQRIFIKALAQGKKKT